MNANKNFNIAPAALLSVWIAVVPGMAAADEVPIVAGKLWGESSAVEKRSYLIGFSNFVVLEHELQSKAEPPPTPLQSSVPDFYRYTDNVTLDDAIRAVDEWYQQHPDRLSTPVLTVLWEALVAPKL